jgi:uncharacterized 2Fe-2S/4Fe-4S cluster protein (DUF4445 family)
METGLTKGTVVAKVPKATIEPKVTMVTDVGTNSTMVVKVTILFFHLF